MTSRRTSGAAEQFERAFVAVQALWPDSTPSRPATVGLTTAVGRELAQQLTRGSRETRARRLAVELATVANSLRARRLR